MTTDERKTWAQAPITWTGDLSDDCTAEWAGLMLRAEWMDEDDGWWAVYDTQKGKNTVDDSNKYSERFLGDEAARKAPGHFRAESRQTPVPIDQIGIVPFDRNPPKIPSRRWEKMTRRACLWIGFTIVILKPGTLSVP